MRVSSIDTARSALSRALDLNARSRHAAASEAFGAVIAWYAERAPMTFAPTDEDEAGAEVVLLVRAMIGQIGRASCRERVF